MNSVNSNLNSLLTNVDTVKDNTTDVDDDIDELIDAIDSAGSLDAMSPADVTALQNRLNSVSSSIGVGGGGDVGLETILGKLGRIEIALTDMGSDGGVARAYNDTAKQKAENIKQFIRLITTELEETGNVKNLEDKMELLEGYLKELKDMVTNIPNAVTNESATTTIQETLNELNKVTTGNDSMQELMAMVEQSMTLNEVMQEDEDGAQSLLGLLPEEMLEMRNDVNALKSLMVEIRGLLDQEVNKPVIHGWLEGN